MLDIDWRSCASMSEDIELEKMEQWVKDFHQTLKRDLNILEVGAYKGKTTALLAQFGFVLTIDTFGDLDDGLQNRSKIGTTTLIEFLDNMKRLGIIENRVHPVVSSTRVLELFTDLEFDVIFIDGNHSYEGITLDIKRCLPHLAESGLMVFHDYKRPGWGFPPFDRSKDDPWSGVAKAVDKYVEQNKLKIVEHFRGIVSTTSISEQR